MPEQQHSLEAQEKSSRMFKVGMALGAIVFATGMIAVDMGEPFMGGALMIAGSAIAAGSYQRTSAIHERYRS